MQQIQVQLLPVRLLILFDLLQHELVECVSFVQKEQMAQVQLRSQILVKLRQQLFRQVLTYLFVSVQHQG